MNQNPVPETPANCSPVFSIAGATPGASPVSYTHLTLPTTERV